MHKDDSFMVENGLSLKRKTRTLQAMLFSLIRKLFRKKFAFDKFMPDIYLTDGPEPEKNEYGFDAKVVHIPGHTKGSIGILTGMEIYLPEILLQTEENPKWQII